jgi:DHA1 family tetracycline resistance protein-like MFS transporter
VDASAVAPPRPDGARRAALAFIFITVLLDILAFGMIIPVLPHLIASFYGGNVSTAALTHGIFAAVFMVMQFACSPIQGALSDRFGRRPVILLSNLGLGLDFILMAVAQTLPLLFIGRVLSGITSASFSTANAYIADVTPPEKRAAAFGKIGMAFGIGFVIAPAIGGWLGNVSLRAPFWVAAVLSLCNFFYGLLVLPESLPKQRRAPFSWKRANPVASLSFLSHHPEVFALAGVLFLMQLAHMVYPSTFVLYADYRFGWGSDMVGNTLAIVGVLSIIVQGGLIGRAIKRWGERRTLLFGLGMGALGFTLYGFAPTGYWFWAAMPIAALWGFAMPAAQGLMTRQVAPTEQGRLQGAVGSLASVAGIAGPLLFTRVFADVTGKHMHTAMVGTVFWMAAAMLLGGFLLAWRATPKAAAAAQAAAGSVAGSDDAPASAPADDAATASAS